MQTSVNMVGSSSQQAGKIVNVNAEIMKNVTIIHNYPAASTSTRSGNVDIDYCPAPVSTFSGRSKDLASLKTLFTQYQVVALVGMGGLGKTQLSRKYVLVNKEVYQYKYWLESETPEKLEKSFRKLANKLHVDTDNIGEVVNDVYKKIQAVPTILVFDNVEKPADVYAYLPTRVDLSSGVTLHVLVTSRWADWTCDEQIQCYKLKPLDISTSVQIFQRKFGEICIETMKKEWEELARMLGHLPLALQVATSYIHKRNQHNSDLRMILAEYMKELTKGADGLLNDPLTEYDNRSVYASMMLTLKQLENNTDDKWKLAVTLINAAAYMNPDRIYKKNLLKLLDNDDNKCILDKALVILTEFSLFNQGGVWNYGNVYTVHRIVQTSIRHNHTVKQTADMYYTGTLKYLHADHYKFARDVLQYANDRASAVVGYYKEYPSSRLLKYLVERQAIIAVQGIFELMTREQIQALINEENLLHWAVGSEDLSMTQLLCNNGADINQLSREKGQSPLHYAMRERHIDIVKWLLQNGAEPTVRDRQGHTALHAASWAVNHEIVSKIIQTDSATVHATDNEGNTPLLNIDYSNKEEDILLTIRVLVKNGADITRGNNQGNIVLHAAAGGACAAAVALILQLNKDLINIVNRKGQTALHVIPYNGIYMDDDRILSTTRVLVESGVDFTKVDVLGNTVLHSAVRGARAAAVSLILQLNNDLINIVNEDDQTSLYVIGNDFKYRMEYLPEEARKNLFDGFKETARLLIMNGLSLDTRDKKGRTPLDTVLPEFKDTLLQVADECNNHLMM